MKGEVRAAIRHGIYVSLMAYPLHVLHISSSFISFFNILLCSWYGVVSNFRQIIHKTLDVVFKNQIKDWEARRYALFIYVTMFIVCER